MTNRKQHIDAHVGELLSGYVDGELTQQERQHVEVHCDACDECKLQLAELRTLRERVSNSRLTEFGDDIWRERMNDTAVETSRGFGWLLVIGAALIAAGFGLVTFIFGTSMNIFEKLLIGGFYLGMILLFVSVLRQRLIERKTDKYKNVEI